MKSKNILILAVGLALIPAAAIFADQRHKLKGQTASADQNQTLTIQATATN